jgi:hypothetical protein
VVLARIWEAFIATIRMAIQRAARHFGHTAWSYGISRWYGNDPTRGIARFFSGVQHAKSEHCGNGETPKGRKSTRRRIVGHDLMDSVFDAHVTTFCY